MPATSLLLVDDDLALSGVLASALAEEGFEVTCARDGRAGLRAFDAGRFDLVVLDVLMPELDGLEVCRRLRQRSQVPVIFLTSRADEVARIRAVLRRAQPAAPAAPGLGEVVEVGLLAIDTGRVEVRWRGLPVALTRSEFLVLLALARHPGFVLGRERLIDLARGDEVVITERTIDTFIKRIRAKLRAVDPAFDAIETVVGVGYRLQGPR